MAAVDVNDPLAHQPSAWADSDSDVEVVEVITPAATSSGPSRQFTPGEDRALCELGTSPPPTVVCPFVAYGGRGRAAVCGGSCSRRTPPVCVCCRSRAAVVEPRAASPCVSRANTVQPQRCDRGTPTARLKVTCGSASLSISIPSTTVATSARVRELPAPRDSASSSPPPLAPGVVRRLATTPPTAHWHYASTFALRRRWRPGIRCSQVRALVVRDERCRSFTCHVLVGVPVPRRVLAAHHRGIAVCNVMML